MTTTITTKTYDMLNDLEGVLAGGMLRHEGQLEEACAKVDTGVLRLVEYFGPNWFDDINLDTLKMSSVGTCIIGQKFDNGYSTRFSEQCDVYHQGVFELGTSMMPSLYSADMGLDVDDYSSYEELTEIWKQRILFEREWWEAE